MLICNNAREFTGEIMFRLCELYSISTAPYHPQSKGLVKRANRKILDCFRHVIEPTDHNWYMLRYDVQVTMNCMVCSSTGETPHMVGTRD